MNEGPRGPSLSRRVLEPNDKADNRGTGKAAFSPSLSPTCYCTDPNNGGIGVTSAPLLRAQETPATGTCPFERCLPPPYTLGSGTGALAAPMGR